MAGPVTPIHFAVPGARDPGISFLRSPKAIRALLSKVSFQEVAWVDVTEPALTWFRERAAAAAGACRRWAYTCSWELTSA
jgi:hypothetical protein